MKKNTSIAYPALLTALLIGLTGCSRTSDDVARWEAKGNTEKLIKAFEDPKAEIRDAAAQALGRLKAESAVDPLASLFDDDETNVVYSAAAALLSIGNHAAASHLMLALRLDQPDVRLMAATGLGELMQTNAVQELALALDDSEEAIALAAANSIAQISDESGSAPLAAKLSSAAEPLRLACVNALGETGGEAGVQGLITALADTSSSIRTAALKALNKIGAPCVPAMLEALKDESKLVRAGALRILADLKAKPTAGPELINYQLAVISTDSSDALDQELISTLSNVDAADISCLLTAAAHSVKDIREHAFFALEAMGEPITDQAMAAAEDAAVPAAKKWFKARAAWQGAPSWRIDLWAALAALNPDFKLDSAKSEYLKLKGRDALRIISADDFAATREYAPLLIDLLGDATCGTIAKEKLIESGSLSALPVIAATLVSDEAIANRAAEIIGELEDPRGTQPLLSVLQTKLDAGEQLTASPFYAALVNINAPEAEPLLLKIRPSHARSIQVFENRYSDVRVMSTETRDENAGSDKPITYRLGYMVGYKVGDAQVTFVKNKDGDWLPDPALPETRSE